MHAYGVPASVTIAQWAVESAWGKAVPKGSNNCKGIMARCKGPKGAVVNVEGKLYRFPLDGTPTDPFVPITTHEVIDGKRIKVVRPLRKFTSMADCFDVHGKLLASAGAYAKARALLPKGRPPTEGEVEAYVEAFAPVYATDPRYSRTLISIMRGRDLYRHNS